MTNHETRAPMNDVFANEHLAGWSGFLDNCRQAAI